MSHIILAGYIDKEENSGKGIYRKMMDQAHGFEKSGLAATIICLENHHVFISGNLQDSIPQKGGSRTCFYLKLFDCCQAMKTDILYLRYPFATRSLLNFLKRMKRHLPHTRIIMEWPTFPYEQEFKGIHSWKYYIDQYFQKKIFTYLDLAVVIGNAHRFHQVPTLSLTNGYHCRDADFLVPANGRKNNWVAVGHWQNWHGLERMIYGLQQYYLGGGRENIQVQVIGEGPALMEYKRLVRQLSLQENIHFLHSVTEDQKNEILSMSSLGIGVLGSHKKNLLQHSPLKHRMYACAGLPFIYSTADPDFDHQSFVLRLSEEDQAIHIPTILAWTNQGNWTRKNIINTSKDLVDWSSRCQKILNALTVNHNI